MLGLTVDATFEDLPEPDVVLLPGGVGSRELLRDAGVLDRVRQAHRTTRLTTSVCSGALVLAAAGLFDGLPAATGTGWCRCGNTGSLRRQAFPAASTWR